jgi:exosome complex RNA-binding protein Csl4
MKRNSGDQVHTNKMYQSKGDDMKQLLTMVLFTVITGSAMATLSNAGESKLIEGNVLKIEGELYTVHDTAGHEVRLHVDKTTHLEGGVFKAGDKVEAHVTEKGHVRAMIHMTASGTMTTPGSKIVEGDVLKTEGEYYIVRDRSGHDVRLHVDKTTHLEGDAFRVGDTLEAYVTDKGHARYMYHIAPLQPSS